MKELVRVVIPDSHGAHIDWEAAKALVRDLKYLRPGQRVWMGDQVDCGGTFSTHQRSYTNEMTESYEDDCADANRFFDLVQATGDADDHALEGNHEQHIERWASRMFQSHKDAKQFVERNDVPAMCEYKRRGFKYYRRSEQYMGISIPGTIRLGKCFFTHGISHSKHATYTHLVRFGACVVHGHTHRAQSAVERTVTSSGIGAYCPGTLAKLQPLYKHTEPTSWSHGYGLQFVQPNGRFIHINVPIIKGESLLPSILRRAA